MIGITPAWIGYDEKDGFSDNLQYVLRRIWVQYNTSFDKEDEYEHEKDSFDYIGYLCNPKWHFERQQKEKTKHVNTQWKAEIERAMEEAGMGAEDDSGFMSL